MAVLSDGDIMREIDNKNVIITPFDKRQLNPNSYDVRLGENYFRLAKIENKIIDTSNPDDIKLMFKGPYKDKEIILNPNENILVHTEEFIGIINNFTCEMKAKSTVGRLGFSILKCAGWGDTGFYGRFGFMLKNDTENYIKIHAGCKIGQIIFYKTENKVVNEYSGKYNAPPENWDPKSILPKHLS